MEDTIELVSTDKKINSKKEYVINKGILEFVINNNITEFLEIEATQEQLESKRLLQDIVNILLTNWQLYFPRLMISITGREPENLPKILEKEFKRVLFKIASTTNAWVFTHGFDSGVAKWIGNLLKDEQINHNIVCLGISTFNMVEYHKEIDKHLKENKFEHFKYGCMNEKKTKLVHRGDQLNDETNVEDKREKLNPDHTHFIFIKDGNTENKYTYGLEFISKLQDLIRSHVFSNMMPKVLIVVNGDRESFKLAISTLKKDVPVLIFADECGYCKWLIEIVDMIKADNKHIKEEIQESNKSKSDEQKIEDADLDVILDKYSLIYAIQFNWQENTFNLDEVLLEIVQKKANPEQNIKFALKWNKIDFARKEIEIINYKRDTKIWEKIKERLFIDALIDDKYEFIEFFLQYDPGLAKTRFTPSGFYFDLFKNEKLKRKSEPFWRLLRKIGQYKSWKDLENEKTREKFDNNFLNNLSNLFKKLTYPTLTLTLILEEEVTLKNTERLLFFWAILTDKLEMAKILWLYSEDHIANSLVASKILSSISKFIPESKDSLMKASEFFENLAVEIVTNCLIEIHDSLDTILMLHITPFYKKSLLSIGYYCECKRFIALPSVQNVLNKIWKNKFNVENDVVLPIVQLEINKKLIYYSKIIFSLIFLGLPATFLLNDQTECSNELKKFEKKIVTEAVKNCKKHKNDLLKEHLQPILAMSKDESTELQVLTSAQEIYYEENKGLGKKLKAKKNIWFNNFISFWQTPVIKYLYCLLSYMVFLSLYGVFIYDNFKPTASVGVNCSCNTTNSTATSTITTSDRKWVIYLLLTWVLSWHMEEINQFFAYDMVIKAKQSYAERITSDNSITIKQLGKTIQYGFKHYFNDNWNCFDQIGLILFYVGFVLYFIESNSFADETMKTATKIIFLTNFIIWSLRFLNYYQEIKVIGQTFRMIRAILQRDIIFFLIVIIILFTTAGMVFHVLGEEIKQEIDHTESIKMIFHHAFWPIFGITDSIETIIGSNSTDLGPEKYKFVFSYTISTLYMVAILILINILIAMFNQTFNELYENAEIRWKYNRYDFILNYWRLSIFPPPLNLISRFVSFMFSLKHVFKYMMKRCCGGKGNDEKCEEVSDFMQNLKKLERKKAEECAKEYMNAFKFFKDPKSVNDDVVNEK